MPVPYIKQTWVDGSAGGTPISAARLGVIEQGIEDAQFPTPGYAVWEDEFFGTGTTAGAIGMLGWDKINTSQGTASFNPGTTDHPGVVRASASGTSGNIYGISTDGGSGNALILPPQINRVIWIVSPNSSNAGSNFRAGMCTDPTTATCGTDAIYWDFTQASNVNWRSISRGASTNTTNNTTVAVTASNWYKLEIRKNNTDWEFWLNDSLKFTHTTNKPNTSTPLQPFCVAHTTAAASKQIDIDYFGLMTVAFGQRWT